MPERIPQSTTIRVPLQAYLSSDHVTPATGKIIAVTISKNGAAYANPSAGATNATEVSNGSYYVDLSTTDAGTLGPLWVLGTCAGVDPVVVIYNVVGVPLVQLANGVDHGGGTATLELGSIASKKPLNVHADSAVFAVASATFSGSTGGGGAPDINLGGGGINATVFAGQFVGNLSGTTGDTTNIAAIKTKTDNLPASPAAVGSAMTLADGAITEAKITTPGEAAGRPTGILAMIRRIFEWGDNKRTRDRTSGVVSLRNAADSANLETQTQSSNTVGSDITDSQSQGS